MGRFVRRLRALIRRKSRMSKMILNGRRTPKYATPDQPIATQKSEPDQNSLAPSSVNLDEVFRRKQFKGQNIRHLQFFHNHAQHCINNKKNQHVLPAPTNSFTLFPLLPRELRSQIWEAVANHPHTVELSCTPRYPKGQGRWFSHSKPPSVMQTNAESREIALRNFDILTFSPKLYLLPPSRPIYVNFSSATLWLCGDMAQECARNLLKENMQVKYHLRQLIIKEYVWKSLDTYMIQGEGVANTMEEWQTSRNIREGLMALESVQFHDGGGHRVLRV